MTVAPKAAASDVMKAWRKPEFASAASTQRSDSPDGGHADVPLSLNA